MEENKKYWFFVRKVHEKLTIFFNHKLPNKIELDEIDEQVFKEMYEWYTKSELFSASEPILSLEPPEQTDIFAEFSRGIEVD